VKIKLVRQWIVAMLCSLLLCSCSHDKTTTKEFGRFVLTEVMRYNSYFGLSRLEYAKMCRYDGELCVKCVNSDGAEPFCDVRIYDDPDSDYLLYTDRRSSYHLVNSASGAELECKNIELISERILNGVYPYWLDGNRLVISLAKNPGSSFDPNRSTYVGYEVQLGTQPCVTRQIWSYPADGYSSSRDLISPDRKGLAWTAYNSKKCVMRWVYGNYVIKEKDINCDQKEFAPNWVGDHPEPGNRY
jgi:hypothetical protein